MSNITISKTVRASEKNPRYQIYRDLYSPPNGIAANFVLTALGLNFQHQTFNTSDFGNGEIYRNADYDFSRRFYLLSNDIIAHVVGLSYDIDFQGQHF